VSERNYKSGENLEGKKWAELIGEPVRTRRDDDQDVGNIEAVSKETLVIRRGLLSGLHHHYYYIPITNVEGWDGNIVWLKVSREELEREYAKHSAPDPAKYYVKSQPGARVTLIQSRHTKDSAFAASDYSSSTDHSE
jgi:hypothetical protein